jgi:hypothetical protein
MVGIPGRTRFERGCVVVSGVIYALTALLFAQIALAQLADHRLIETGTMVQSSIVTVSPGKNTSSGMVVYRLPDGLECRDWAELGPNGAVHPGEPLTVAVDGSCGHPVSTKRRLAPWLYVCLCLGTLLYPPFFMWRSHRRRMAAVAQGQS